MFVADSSTLILLARIELLRLVAERHRILITKEVLVECTAKETLDSQLIQTLVGTKMLTVEDLTRQDRNMMKRLRSDFKVGKGEASVLALAHRRALPLATDDKLAIKVARLLNLSFVTAIHFLLEACENTQIERKIALEKLEKLHKIGRYSDHILADAKRRLGGVP